MLSIIVLRELLSRNLINTSTEITCSYKGLSIDGRATANEQDVILVNNISYNEEKDTYLFSGGSTTNGKLKTYTHRNIVEIDGMEPYRFARVYGISPLGSKIVEGKRRGRKPKIRNVEGE